MYITSTSALASPLSNSYITGARDVWHLLHRSPRANARGLRAINGIHPERARDITILYPEYVRARARILYGT